MKKHLQLLTGLCIITASGLFAQRDTIAAWTFPTGEDTVDIYPNAGLSSNSKFAISAADTTAYPNTVYREFIKSTGVTDYSFSAKGWQNGENAKLWSIEFKAEGFTNLKISSKHRSGKQFPGPRDWKLQCRFGDEDWIDIPDGSFNVVNDWTTGVIDEIPLPEAFNDPGASSICIRWIMTSNTNSNGGKVLETGVSKIDDVVVTGTTITNRRTIIYNSNLRIYPNPARDYIHIESADDISEIMIHNLQGGILKHITDPGNPISIDIRDLTSGLHLVHSKMSDKSYTQVTKLIVE